MKKETLNTLVAAVATVALVACHSALAAAPVGWTDDFENAKKKAKAEGKLLLVDFSGSDWCGWCMKLDREVFAKPEFVSAAKKCFVLVLVDSPNDKSKLSPVAAKQNPQLVSKYNIRGFPTVLVMDPDEKILKRTGYRKGGPSAYLEHLEDVMKQAPAYKRGGGAARSGAFDVAELLVGRDGCGTVEVDQDLSNLSLKQADPLDEAKCDIAKVRDVASRAAAAYAAFAAAQSAKDARERSAELDSLMDEYVAASRLAHDQAVEAYIRLVAHLCVDAQNPAAAAAAKAKLAALSQRSQLAWYYVSVEECAAIAAKNAGSPKYGWLGLQGLADNFGAPASWEAVKEKDKAREHKSAAPAVMKNCVALAHAASQLRAAGIALMESRTATDAKKALASIDRLVAQCTKLQLQPRGKFGYSADERKAIVLRTLRGHSAMLTDVAAGFEAGGVKTEIDKKLSAVDALIASKAGEGERGRR